LVGSPAFICLFIDLIKQTPALEFLSNWNNYPAISAQVVTADQVSDVREIVRSSKNIIARGNGRSYGDASLNDVVFNSLSLNRILHFDEDAGTIEVESGILISQILERIVPAGFFLPVVPGTKYITVGGAIAADIHGKNHCIEGSFSRHIISLTLCTEDGNLLNCSPKENSELFYATCGGMGLTGIIVSATLKLTKVETSWIYRTTTPTVNFDVLFEIYEKNKASHYIASWLNIQSFKRERIRAITDLGVHLLKNELPDAYQCIPLEPFRKTPLRIPFGFNGVLLNPISIRCFNAYHFHRRRLSRREKIVQYDSFFFPLDSISNWNKLYGKGGMLQYQFVIPLMDAPSILKKIFFEVIASHQTVNLAVLKRLGASNPQSFMSFPMEGYTVSMDFNLSTEVLSLLNRLDHIVADAGGRIYLAKDARMHKWMFRKTYPKIVHHGHFKSLQSSRLQD
jgi:FAD/FMN-containing dehydrogenase